MFLSQVPALKLGKRLLLLTSLVSLTSEILPLFQKKPIESGCIRQGDELIPQDALALKKAANYSGPLSDVCPYRFEPPISPVRAAHLAKKVLTTEQLFNICLQGSEKGFLLVEGAGGFYSPLAENGLNADLAVALQLPVLLVADDKLGVLSQVLLNAEAIQMRGLHLAGVVLNNQKNYSNEYMDNTADLRERLGSPVFTSPFIKDGQAQLSSTLIDSLLMSFNPETPNISAVR